MIYFILYVLLNSSSGEVSPTINNEQKLRIKLKFKKKEKKLRNIFSFSELNILSWISSFPLMMSFLLCDSNVQFSLCNNYDKCKRDSIKSSRLSSVACRVWIWIQSSAFGFVANRRRQSCWAARPRSNDSQNYLKSHLSWNAWKMHLQFFTIYNFKLWIQIFNYQREFSHEKNKSPKFNLNLEKFLNGNNRENPPGHREIAMKSCQI